MYFKSIVCIKSDDDDEEVVTAAKMNMIEKSKSVENESIGTVSWIKKSVVDNGEGVDHSIGDDGDDGDDGNDGDDGDDKNDNKDNEGKDSKDKDKPKGKSKKDDTPNKDDDDYVVSPYFVSSNDDIFARTLKVCATFEIKIIFW